MQQGPMMQYPVSASFFRRQRGGAPHYCHDEGRVIGESKLLSSKLESGLNRSLAENRILRFDGVDSVSKATSILEFDFDQAPPLERHSLLNQTTRQME